MSQHSPFKLPEMSAKQACFATDSATGKVVPLYREVDAAGVVSYTDESNTPYVLSATETAAPEPIRYSIGSEVLALDNSGTIAKLASVPANSVQAEIQVHLSDNMIFTTEGTDPAPAAGTGKLALAGSNLELEGADEIADFKAAALNVTGDDFGTNGVKIYVEYFNVTEDGRAYLA